MLLKKLKSIETRQVNSNSNSNNESLEVENDVIEKEITDNNKDDSIEIDPIQQMTRNVADVEAAKALELFKLKYN